MPFSIAATVMVYSIAATVMVYSRICSIANATDLQLSNEKEEELHNFVSLKSHFSENVSLNLYIGGTADN